MPEQDLRQDLRQAIADLHITVPVYRIEPTDKGLRLYLYGHSEPVEWIRTQRKLQTAKKSQTDQRR